LFTSKAAISTILNDLSIMAERRFNF
jgi:hypothetical protein